jgi:hypothetical protein
VPPSHFSRGREFRPVGQEGHRHPYGGAPPSKSLLQECDPIASECDSSALHREVVSSGTRWPSCKLMDLLLLEVATS